MHVLSSKKSFTALTFTIAAAVFGNTPVAGATVAEWTFETSKPAAADSKTISGIVAEHGLNAASSTASGSHASASTDYSNPVGNGSAESFNSNNWAVGDYYQFQTSTVGFQDITLSWDQARSGTGPSGFKLQYSIDGTSYTDFGTYTVSDVSWASATPDPNDTSSFTQNLSNISALDNDSSVFFRLTATSAPSATSGTNRVDNFVISAVPEPASAAVLGLAGMLALRRRRR